MARSNRIKLFKSPLKNTGDKDKEQVGLPKGPDYSALSKDTHSSIQLSNIYGRESKAKALGRENYQKAKADYLSQSGKENIDFKSLKNIYTTKSENEDNLTPWQERARKDAEAQNQLAIQERDALRQELSDTWSNLDPAVQRARSIQLSKALSGDLGKSAGWTPEERKLIESHKTHGAGVESFTPEELNALTGKLERLAGGNKRGKEYGALLQNLYKSSPIKKDLTALYNEVTGDDINESPLKRTDLSNVYGGAQNYATLSQRIGSGVDQAIQQNRDREMLKRKQAQDDMRQQMLDMQFAEMKQKQVEQFIVPADTGYNAIDNAVNAASRTLVDQQAALVQQAKNGDITTDELAQKTAMLKSQVPGLKAFKEGLSANVASFQEGVLGNNISNATDPQTLAMYQAITNPEGDAQLTVDDQGLVQFTGTFEDPETGEVSPFQIPAQGIGQMPKVTMKVPSPEQTLLPVMQQISQNFSQFDDTAQEQVRATFDQIVANGGDDALKSLAADHFGAIRVDHDGNPETEDVLLGSLTSQDLTALSTKKAPEGSDANSALEAIVEDAYINKAAGFFNQANLQRQQAEAKLAYQKALTQRQNQLANQGKVSETAAQKNYADQLARAGAALSSAGNYSDPNWWLDQGFGNVMTSSNLSGDNAKKFKKLYGDKEGVIVPSKKGNIFIPSDMDPSQARKVIARQIYGVDPNELGEDPFSYDQQPALTNPITMGVGGTFNVNINN